MTLTTLKLLKKGNLRSKPKSKRRKAAEKECVILQRGTFYHDGNNKLVMWSMEQGFDFSSETGLKCIYLSNFQSNFIYKAH